MKLEEVLFEYFGYKEFRPLQKEIIEQILAKRDVIAILPTGAGKSIIYQVPGLIFGGLTLVVTPLIALMRDQVENLKKRGIRANFISSELNSEEKNYVYENLDKYNFLYVSPERLLQREFYERVTEVSFIVVDEAHTLKWGLDFRKAMLLISNYINRLAKRPSIAAFTATADKKLIAFLKDKLGLTSPFIKKLLPWNDNIKIEVLKEKRDLSLFKTLKKFSNQKVIVYCLTRKNVEKLYQRYRNVFSTSYYHGGMLKEKKDKNQNLFKSNQTNIMIATNAFGMGIDIPDIRCVILYDLPLTISDLIQQIGRAGRDGKKAWGIVLFSKDSLTSAIRLISGSSNFSQKGLEFDKVTRFCQIKTKKEYLVKYFA